MTVSEIIVRPLSGADAAAVAAHITRVVKSSPNLAYHPNLENWLNNSYSVPVVEKKITENKNVSIWSEGELIACGFIKHDVGYITGIYISQQRKGYGKQILNHLIELSEADPYMSVHNKSGMTKLAENVGFVDIGEDPDTTFFPDEKYRIYKLFLH